MLTGSSHVDQITAMSAYADMAYVRYILLTVAYMPRQQCKMLTKLIRILYLQQQFKFVGQLVLLSCVLCTKYIYYILRMHKLVFLIFSSTLNVYNFFVIYNYYNLFFKLILSSQLTFFLRLKTPSNLIQNILISSSKVQKFPRISKSKNKEETKRIILITSLILKKS